MSQKFIRLFRQIGYITTILGILLTVFFLAILFLSEKFFERAQHNLLKNNLEQALFDIKYVTKLNPSFGKYHNLKAKIEREIILQRIKAEQHLESSNPRTIEYFLMATQISPLLDEFKISVNSHKKAIKLSPYNPYFHKEYADTLIAEKSFIEAADEMMTCIELYPKNLFFYNEFGKLFTYIGNYKLAKKVIKAGIALEDTYLFPPHPDIIQLFNLHLQLAKIYEKQKHTKSAYAEYKHILELLELDLPFSDMYKNIHPTSLKIEEIKNLAINKIGNLKNRIK